MAPADLVSAASQLSKWSRTAPSVIFRGRLGRQAVLGLADESGVADEAGDQRAAARHQVVAGDLRGLLVACQFAVSLDALEDRGPKAGDMGAALGRGDGVAVGLDEAVAHGCPVDGPFDLAGLSEFFVEFDGASEGFVGIGCGCAEGFAQVVGEAAGEVEGRLDRGFAIVDGSDFQRISTPEKR